MIAIIGLLVGIAVGILWHPVVPMWAEAYLPIAIIAALDAVFGGFRALMEKRFDDRIFVVSFLSNVLIAAFLVFLGDQLGRGGADLHRRRRRPGHADLRQRRRHPSHPVPGVRR